MVRACVVMMTVLGAGAAAQDAAKPVEQEVVPASENAALKYWAAWWQLGEDRLVELTPLEPEGELDEAARDVCEQLVIASSLDRCDFGHEPDAFLTGSLDWLRLMRMSARLLLHDATEHLDRDSTVEAAERIAGVLGLSRHTMQEPVLISSLVSIAVFEQTAAFIDENRGALDNDARRVIAAALNRFDDTDPFGLAGAIASESEISSDSMISAINDGTFDPDLFPGYPDAALLQDAAGEALANSRAVRIAQARLKKDVLLMQRATERIAEAWNAPDGDARFEATMEEINQGDHGRFAQLMAGTYPKIRRNDMAARAKLNALRAWASGETETLEFEQEGKR